MSEATKMENLKNLMTSLNEDFAARSLLDVELDGTIQTDMFVNDEGLKDRIKEHARESDSEEDSLLNGYSWGEARDMLWNDTMSNSDYEALKDAFMDEMGYEEVDRRWGNYFDNDELETYLMSDVYDDIGEAVERMTGTDIHEEMRDDEGWSDTAMRVLDQHMIKQAIQESIEPSLLYKEEQAKSIQEDGESQTQVRRRAM